MDEKTEGKRHIIEYTVEINTEEIKPCGERLRVEKNES